MERPDEKIEIGNSGSAAESQLQTTKALWCELLKTTFFVLAALAVITYSSMAWFTSNSRVSAAPTVLSARDEVVRLATRGERQSEEVTWLNLPEGNVYEYHTDLGATEYYYYTEGETIALRLSNEEVVVSPGESGTISFYVIPTGSEATSVTLHLGLVGYAAVTDSFGEVKAVNRIGDDPVLDALLSGHILLFDEYSDGHYSGWRGTLRVDGSLKNSITIEIPAAAGENPKPVGVTLYWVWPLLYENMVGTDPGDLYAPGDGGYELFEDFVDGQAVSLLPVDGSSYHYSRIFMTKELSLSGADARTRAYNRADEYIGTNADYLYLIVQTNGAEE